MLITLPIVRVRYDGRDASQHLMDVQELGRSLSGIGRMLSSASVVLVTGEIPKRRFTPQIRYYAQPVQDGCFPIDIVGYYDGDMFQAASELVAAIGAEAMTRLISAAILISGGRASEVGRHVTAILELTKQMEKDRHEEVIAIVGRWARSEESILKVVELFAQYSQRNIVEAARPVGRTCSSEQVGDLRRGGVVVDLPTAQAVRSQGKLEVGDMGDYIAHVDGIIAHNRTVKLYVQGYGDQIITGDLVDPAADIWPDNIYTESLKKGYLTMTAKPVLTDGKIKRLSVFNARRLSDEEVPEEMKWLVGNT